MNGPSLSPRLSGRGEVIPTPKGWKLAVPSGGGGYRLAQLDDHSDLRRDRFPWKPPVRLSLRARVSFRSLPGTWGFGFWNDPFRFDVNPWRRPGRLPAPPQAIWFFSASLRSYLSFRDDLPANGLRAQVFRSLSDARPLMRAALCMLASRRAARRIFARHIEEEAAAIDLDPSDWHEYEINWQADTIRCSVDGNLVLNATTQPQPPLGLVIWIDNQRAAFDPQGRLSWGVEPNPSEAWLEVERPHVAADWTYCPAGPTF